MEVRSSHSLLIIPPLSVILVSCFLFVLMQPSSTTLTNPAVSSNNNTPTVGQSQAILPMAQNEPLPLIDPVVVVDHTNGGPGSITTSTPQPNASSSSELQASSTNNQAPLNTHITVPANTKSKGNDSPLKKVTNSGKKTAPGKNQK